MLDPFYPEAAEFEPIGEAWLTADICRLPGTSATLGKLMRLAAVEVLGRSVSGFPLLIKLLFTCDYLSVQVHPDDRYARRHGLASGKTEMWHVLRATSGARIGLNLLPGTALETFAAACRAGRSRELLEWWPAAPGDSFFVPAGTVHALGPGLVLCEVQQPSDTTFRLDDFGRRDSHGALRPLHLEAGLAVAQPRTVAGRLAPPAEGGGLLVHCEHFHVEKRVLAQTAVDVPQGFRVLVALAGALRVESENHWLDLPLGRAAVVPATAAPLRLSGAGEALEVTLP